MILYIAGKMTGLPDWGRAQFNKAEDELTKKGHAVLNPARLPLGLRHENYMRIGLCMLDAAEAIYLLKGWEKSKGARLELKYALYQRKEILFEEDDPPTAEELERENALLKDALLEIGQVIEQGT